MKFSKIDNPELVFIPAPAIGHITPMMEFAKRMVDRDGRLSVTVLTISGPMTEDADAYIKLLAASDPRIRYITLPPVDLPSPEHLNCPENYFSLFIESHKPHIRDAINKYVVSCSKPLAGLVLDTFCSPMIDVANDFDVPSYLFFTSNAAFLGLMNYMPTHHYKSNGKPIDICDPDLIVPTYSHPVPAKMMPSIFLNNQTGYDCIIKHILRIKETKGIIINTFSELESYAVNALASDKKAPPVFPVGPLLDLKNARKGSISEREKILKWLDAQPSSSVVFLCFGSGGVFEPPQLMQIAIALERSGHRFLWSIHHAEIFGKVDISKGLYSDVAKLLPEGFLEKTRDRGMLCGWAPQVDVLAHEAIGAFVSHCGWNSISESLWYGVPIVTFPTYAEQQLNALQMVKDLGTAVELKLDYRIHGDVIIDANEIEKAITRTMDNENRVRRKVKEVAEMGREAVKDGGSSFVSMGSFIQKIWDTQSSSYDNIIMKKVESLC